MIKVKIDLNESSDTYGKLIVEVENLGDLMIPLQTNTKVELEVKSPLATILELQEIMVLEGVGESDVFTLDIPSYTENKFLTGTYKFKFVLSDNDEGATPDRVVESEYKIADFNTCDPDDINDMDVSIDVDCYVGKLIIDDNTDYSGYTITEYNIVVDHPIIEGVTPIPDTVSEDNRVVVDVPYTNVEYKVSISSIFSKVEEVDDVIYTVEELLSYSKKVYVECNTDSCGIIKCAADEINAIRDQACNSGGLSAMKSSDRDKFHLLNAYLSLYVHYNNCRDSERSKKYYDGIKELIGKSCDECDSKPKKLETGSNNLSYLQGDSAYDVWINLGNEGTEQDFIDSISAAPPIQGFTSIFPNYSGGLTHIEAREREATDRYTYVAKMIPTSAYDSFDDWRYVNPVIDGGYMTHDHVFPIYNEDMDIIGKARYFKSLTAEGVEVYFFAAASDQTAFIYLDIPVE